MLKTRVDNSLAYKNRKVRNLVKEITKYRKDYVLLVHNEHVLSLDLSNQKEELHTKIVELKKQLLKHMIKNVV